MDISGESSDERHIFHVLLTVEDSLVEMRDAPTERDVILEQLGKDVCSLTGVGVAPCAECGEHVAILVERHVAVHHRADADSGKRGDLHAIFLLHVLAEVAVAVLNAKPDSFQTVGPEIVYQLIFPFVAPLGYGVVVLVDEDSLDAGRAKLYTEDGFTRLYGCFCFFRHEGRD